MSLLAVLEEISRANPATDRLSLVGLELDHLDAQALAFLRVQFPSARHLDLRDNALTELRSDIGSFVPQLVTLDIRNNPLTSIPELSEALASCQSLQSLFVTLTNPTDEKVLCVMLPTLRHLNGVPVGDRDRRSPLALDLSLTPTPASSNGDSPTYRGLDTPPSTTASTVRPVRSPQEKRELRLQFAHTKKTNNALSARCVYNSVKPTELPATISDEHTDWRKLLKQTTAKHEQAQRTNETEDSTSVPDAEISSTRAFIAELKGIVRGFQKPQTSDPTRHVLDQLERKIDLLALQLKDVEKNPSSDDGLVVTASLAARWRLVEAGTLYAAHRVNNLDTKMGTGLHRLLQTQTQVVEAMLRHVNDAIYAQQKWQTASTSQQHVAEQQKQQMKLLLDVAETLEKDLETLQTKYDHEKAEREQAQAASKTLQSECEELKLQLEQQQRQTPDPTPSVPVSTTQRRIRKRNESTEERMVRPAPPTANKTPSPQPLRSSSPPKPSANPPILRSFTLKQLVDLIQCILTSKAKYDERIHAIGAPSETVEQHMYTYLNQRFGLQPLIIEYASAIWKGCQMYTRQDNDVAMFHALLRNQVDEDFVGIKHKLQRAVQELLRAYFHARHPLKTESVIQNLVDTRLRGGTIYEDEWTELLMYLYDPSDSSILLRLVKRKVEAYDTHESKIRQDGPSNRSRGVPFTVFEKLLTDYQLQGRLKLLEKFRFEFNELDRERVGILTRRTFRELVSRIAPRKSDGEVHKLWERVDPFDHDSVTFSDAVRCLLPDIRQHSANRRTETTKPSQTTR